MLAPEHGPDRQLCVCVYEKQERWLLYCALWFTTLCVFNADFMRFWIVPFRVSVPSLLVCMLIVISFVHLVRPACKNDELQHDDTIYIANVIATFHRGCSCESLVFKLCLFSISFDLYCAVWRERAELARLNAYCNKFRASCQAGL